MTTTRRLHAPYDYTLRTPGARVLATRRSNFGATFHPDSWNLKTCMYRVRDAGDETIAELAAFYGVSVHDINVLNGTFINNQGKPQQGNGDPAVYGAFVGAWINMPAKACDLARSLPCPAGWYGHPGECTTDKPTVDPTDITPTNPPGGTPATTKPPMSTGAKVAIGVTATAAALAVGYGVYKAFS